MRRRSPLIFLFFLACFLAPGALRQAAAKSYSGYVTQNVNLRAGPDEGYPPIKLIRESEYVIIAGCLDDLKWCEVESGDEHGWVYADFLRSSYGPQKSTAIMGTYGPGSVGIIIYDPRNYWNRYYKDKPFYKDRDQWVKDREHKDGKEHDKKNWSANPRPQRPDTNKPQAKTSPPANPVYERLKKEEGYNPLCKYNAPDC